MVKRFITKKGMKQTLVLAGVISLSGCTFVGNIAPNRVDYKSASKAKTTSLEVPPDLTQIRRDNRFGIPDAELGSATASSYNLKRSGGNVETANGVVAPDQIKDMRIVRNGNTRYLVVKQKPEVLWPILKDFWQQAGFVLKEENEATGVMETDWAENRAKIPQDFIRETIGKVFDSLYSTGERDKFRTRVERAANGDVEVYISHRGAQEVLVGNDKATTTWTSRATDPGLEAEFLSLLMVRMGVDETKARAAVVAENPGVARSKLITLNGLGYLETDEGFDRSWRRVGLALDRIGFTIEDRDRSQGLYFVRYVDQDIDAKAKGSNEGFFSKLFSWGSSDAVKDGQKYRILVKENGTVSNVIVYGEDGKVSDTPVANKILNVLNEQLK
jgi:outer membrane protein assembly factor BamC